MRRLILSLARGGVALLALCVLLWAGFVALSCLYARGHADAAPLPRAQAIVVISGPGAEDYIAVGDTAARVARGIALWEAGHAPLVVLSGSGAHPGQGFEPDTVGMTRLALLLGLPEAAIVPKDRSFSTLQNGLFTAALPQIDPSEPILLVTNRYHLARAWASFRWAGFAQVVPVAADSAATGSVRMHHMEGLKWNFNIARALGASLALGLGMPEARVWPYLQ